MTPTEVAAYAIAASILKVALWAVVVIIVAAAGYALAWWLDDDVSGFDRHADQAIDLTRPSIGDEIEAYLRGRQP